MNQICIRHEDKYPHERRSPIVPEHVKLLLQNKKIDISVQTSDKRIFTDAEYEAAGAKVVKDTSACNVIMGVKEIPMHHFKPEKTYVFFSHTIKGQPYNMPMLRRLMELKCNLIDYEQIVNDRDQRTVFFGHYAGLAGMIDSLWSLGMRLKEKGIENPFSKLKQAVHYHSLEEAAEAISEVGHDIAENGLPAEIHPLTIGITGSGHVSAGVQEILNLLPVKEITPENLHCLDKRRYLANNLIYKVVFHKRHLAVHRDGSPFTDEDYKAHPENYTGIFENHLPKLTMLINGIYWDARFPRLVTKKYLREAFAAGTPKLQVIGDISCDVNGSIEITHKGTDIDDPVFVYNPKTDSPTMGFEGEGILVMAVDILPTELPRDASREFSEALFTLIKPLANCDFSRPFAELNLPRPLKKAMILHHGKLTHDYKYMEEFLM